MDITSRPLARVGWAFTAFAYLFTLLGANAQAEHVLPVLGTAPLLGRITSTTQLQQRVMQRHVMFETAAADLGLSGAQTSQLERRIMSGQVRWVRVPRHLDAMTWAWDGSVYMYRDVIIPAAQYGWEIDLRTGSHVQALFIPAACGNLSLVERAVRVAYVPPPVPTCPIGMIGNPPNCYPPQCPSGMVGTPPNCATPQCPAGMMGTPPNCYTPQCPAGTMGSPPNCCQMPPAYNGQPSGAPTQPGVAMCATPPPALTTVVVREHVNVGVVWWIVPLAFIGFLVGGHYHYQPPPPPPPPVKCPPHAAPMVLPT